MPKSYERYLDILGMSSEEFGCECEACEQLDFEINNDDEEGDECEQQPISHIYEDFTK